jgi:hypothetical protein
LEKTKSCSKESDSKSDYVGIVNERQRFELTVQHVYQGTKYVNICRDNNNNIVIYKGTQCWGKKGTLIDCLARVKEHSECDGIKQTIIQRPTNVGRLNGEWWEPFF